MKILMLLQRLPPMWPGQAEFTEHNRYFFLINVKQYVRVVKVCEFIYSMQEPTSSIWMSSKDCGAQHRVEPDMCNEPATDV